MSRFDVSRDRFVNRGKDRRTIVIRFRLSRAARLVLVVRGPGPTCETVARIAVRGRKGSNRVRFDGRIDDRPLERGTYLLELRQRGRSADLGREYVTIVASGAPRAARVLPRCEESDEGTSFVLGAEWIGVAGTLDLPAAPPARAADQPSAASESGVRGEESPALALPWPSIGDEVEELPPVLAVVLLALLVGSLLGLVGAVVHYLRSPQV